MAASVPTRITVGLGFGWAIGLSTGACGDSTPLRPARETLEAILAQTIGDQRDRFATIQFELREDTDATPTTVILGTGNRFRMTTPDGESRVIDGESSWIWSQVVEPRPLTSEELTATRRLRSLFRAAFLCPLTSARELENRDRQTIRAVDGQTTWLLEHADDLPLRIESTEQDGVRFIELREPPGLRLPSVIEVDGLGRFMVRLLADARSEIDASAFTPPSLRRQKLPEIKLSTEDTPTEPVFKRGDACRWLVVADPGTWAGRKEACRTAGQRLGDAGQGNAGDPFLFERNGKNLLAIPFRSQSGDEYAPSQDELIEPSDTRTAAVVYAPTGEFEARIARGRAMLDQLLERHHRTAGGPLRITINLFYEALDTDSELESSVEVRLELPVAEDD